MPAFAFLTLPLALITALSFSFLTFDFHAPRTGEIEEGSAAWRVGLRGGELIESVNGEAVGSWEELETMIASHAGQKISLAVVSSDGGRSQFILAPETVETRKFGIRSMQGFVPGLTNRIEKAVLSLKSGSPLAVYGVETGDVVVEVQGRNIRSKNEFISLLPTIPHDAPLNLTVLKNHDGKRHSIGLPPVGAKYSLASLKIDDPKFAVRQVFGRAGRKLGLAPGDRFVLIQGQAVGQKFDLARVAAELRNNGGTLRVDLVRGEKLQHLEIKDAKVDETSTKASYQEFLAWLGVFSWVEYDAAAGPASGNFETWFRYWLNYKMWTPSTED